VTAWHGRLENERTDAPRFWREHWSKQGETDMLHINEDQLGAEIMKRFGGRLMAALVAFLAVGILIGAVLF
jgi:hypothetical protein